MTVRTLQVLINGALVALHLPRRSGRCEQQPDQHDTKHGLRHAWN